MSNIHSPKRPKNWVSFDKMDLGLTLYSKSRQKITSSKDAKWTYHSMAHGNSTVMIECPLCGEHTEAHIWSFASSGKRCDKCGATIHYSGVVDIELKRLTKANIRLLVFHKYLASGHALEVSHINRLSKKELIKFISTAYYGDGNAIK